jgi:hypothetical protein
VQAFLGAMVDRAGVCYVGSLAVSASSILGPVNLFWAGALG